MASKRPAGRKTQSGVHTAAQRSPRKKGTRKKRRMRAWVKVVLSVLAALIIAAIVIAGTVTVYAMRFINGDMAINLEYYKNNQSQTTIIYGKDSSGNDVEMAKLHGTENRIWIDLDQMSPHLTKAFIALEDKRFEKHHGVDWVRTIGVMVKPSAQGQGGSTLTQQLIKNLTNDKDVTIVRKFNEIMNALNMEKHYTKNQIIEAYLNTLYLSEGCYGVQTAAQTYFGKDAKDLNLAESASIAAITQYPTKYDPLINPENNKKRQQDCLRLMLEQGKITQAEYDEAIAYNLVFTNSKEYKGSSSKTKNSQSQKQEVQSYYVDYVIDSVIEDLQEKYGYSKQYATRMIYGGGLKIYSAIDFDVQKAMENVYVNRKKNCFPQQSGSEEKKVQSAMSVLEYDGRIAGIVGGAGKKGSNRELNRAADSPRQPGSSIKPISIYTPAIEVNQIYWSSLIQDSPILTEGKYWPKNYEGEGSGKMVTVQKALAVSKNTIPVRILQDLGSNNAGLSRSYDFLVNKLGLGHLVPSGNVNDKNYSALALGGMAYGATTLEMASAYEIFNTGGKYSEPYCYYKVTDAKGAKVLLEHTANPQQVVTEETAVVMNKLLQTVVTDSEGTARKYKGAYPMFAKTGTTTDNNDFWFVGGTPKYVAAVWYGYDLNKRMDGNTQYARQIWKTVMDNIYSSKKLSTGDKFYESAKVVEKEYCTVTGLLAGPTCPKAKGWYKIASLPDTCAGNHPAANVASPSDPSVPGEVPTTASSVSTTAGA